MAATHSVLFDESYVMVAAIDFGTTFSGYSFSFKTNQDEIRMNKAWGDETGLPSFKAPTSVLLDNGRKLLAFGYEAESMYNDLVVNKGEESCELYRHFKMMLHGQGLISRKSKVQSVRGKWEDAMTIFTHALNYIKCHLISALAKSVASAPDVKLIRWVLTVPAIWSDESKQFMREVAFQAGLIDEQNSRRMIICLEPEAASIYCRRLEIDSFSSGNEKSTKLLHKDNTKYMIVDAGGGTVDITVHEVQEDGRVKELRAASGGAWGGTKVDQNFVDVLANIFGKNFINHFQKNKPSEWLDLHINFEKRKRSVKAKGLGSNINIPLGLEFGSEFKELTGKDVKEVLKNSSVQGVSFKSGNICFESDVVRRLFEPVTAKIVNHIKKEIKKCPELELILLVGGFGESDYLRDALETAFCPKLQLLVPLEASVAIVKGATMFGHNYDLISSRIARKTYGVATLIKFDSSKHPEHRKKHYPEKGDRVEIFDVFLKKGDSVPSNDVHTFNKVPMSSDQKRITLKFYSAEERNVTFPNDPTVSKIGSLTISIPDTKGGIKRKVAVSLHFGLTEVIVEAYEVKHSGKGEKFTTLDLLTK